MVGWSLIMGISELSIVAADLDVRLAVTVHVTLWAAPFTRIQATRP